VVVDDSMRWLMAASDMIVCDDEVIIYCYGSYVAMTVVGDRDV